MTPVTSEIAVYDTATGALIEKAPRRYAPKAGSGRGYVDLPSGFSDDAWVWDSAKRAMIADLTKTKAILIKQVKDEAEARKMESLTPGGAKKQEYADKAAEVRFFDSLGGSVNAILAALTLMTPERRDSLFPWAMAEQAEFGEPSIAPAIARFRAGMKKSVRNNQIGAREQRLCRDINAAATVDAAQQIAAKRAWPA